MPCGCGMPGPSISLIAKTLKTMNKKKKKTIKKKKN
jgi:hypothetical protein